MKPAEPRQSRWKGAVGVGALSLLLVASLALADGPKVPQAYGPGVFEGCISGDTCAWSLYDAPIRLYGVRAPDPWVDQMYAIDARNALIREIKGAAEIEIRVICRDRYRRIVALVLADGRDLSSWMVAHGYARETNRSLCR